MRARLAALVIALGMIAPGIAPAQTIVAPADHAAPADTAADARRSPTAAVDGWHAPGVSMFLPPASRRVSTDLGPVTGFTPRTGGLQLDIAISDRPAAFAPGGESLGVGVTYGRSFADIDLRMSSSLDLARLPEKRLGLSDSDADLVENSVGFGAAVDIGRFTLGGSVDRDMDFEGDAVTTPLTAWDVGVGYDAGPWGLSLSYGRNQRGLGSALQPDQPVDAMGERGDSVTLGFSYRLADGVDVGAFGSFVDGEGSERSDGLGGGDRDVQGFVIGSGVEIDF